MITVMMIMVTLHAFLMRNLSCFSFLTKALFAAASPTPTGVSDDHMRIWDCQMITMRIWNCQMIIIRIWDLILRFWEFEIVRWSYENLRLSEMSDQNVSRWSDNNNPYILKAGFAGSQKPQTSLNFLQKDCVRTRKLSILQFVLEIKVKRKDCCHSTLM